MDSARTSVEEVRLSIRESVNYGGLPMKYRVLLQADEDGQFVAEVPALPGCISQGKSRSEALKNIKEAISLSTLRACELTVMLCPHRSRKR